jgi:pilus assembly protein Flp/PilA
MFEDPINVGSSVASFVSELVQGQPPKLAQESPMLSLYTNLSVRLRSDEKGATAVEYGIMVALIAVVIIVAVTLLGNNLTTMFGDIACKFGGGTYTAGAAGAASTCAKP